MATPGEPLLEITDLAVEIRQNVGKVHAVNGVSLSVRAGETVGVVGESGCGKSITAYSVMSLLPEGGRVVSGSVTLTRSDGRRVELTGLDPDSLLMRDIRGRDIAMIYQEPTAAFSPVHRFVKQVGEAYLAHYPANRAEVERRVAEMFRKVGIPEPERRINEYPFQFSGGMNQRAMIAMALICAPRLLIADEPTTAVDVTTQAQILRLLAGLKNQGGLAMLLITHNLGVVAHMAERVYVMYAGRIMEEAPVKELFARPRHPYTKALLAAIPRLSGDRKELASIPGSVPDGFRVPHGCVFHPRCPSFQGEKCRGTIPKAVQVAEGHTVWCVLYGE